MKFIDRIKKKIEQTVGLFNKNKIEVLSSSTRVDIQKIEIDKNVSNSLKKSFVAFDTETTGRNSTTERIVEIGAVYFVYGVAVKTFVSLINPNITISPSATQVNGITK